MAMKGKTVTAITIRNTASTIGSRVLLYAGPGTTRLVGGTAFYIVLAFASIRRGVEFGAALTVMYTLFTFISNTGFNWFEQSYLRYQDETVGRAVGWISFVVAALAVLPALYVFRALAPPYVAILALLFAAATMFETTFRFTIANLIVQHREGRYARLVLQRAICECGSGIAAILLAKSNSLAIVAVFAGLVLARVLATDPVFIFRAKHRASVRPKIPAAWFVYGMSLTVLLAIAQAVTIYVQHEANLANTTESALVVGQKYIQQAGQVVSGIMLVTLSPRIFAVESSRRPQVLAKFSLSYSAIVILSNLFLATAVIVLTRRLGMRLSMSEIVAFFIGSTALSLSVMSHKSFELIERTYMCVVLMLAAALITVLWMSHVMTFNRTDSLVIGFTAVGPLYYFGSAVLDLVRVRISMVHAVFHVGASSLLIVATFVIFARGFGQ
jgi:hypothetical protein